MQSLFPNQERFLDNFEEIASKGNTVFYISGISGCGKTFAINTILQSYRDSSTMPILFEGDSVLNDCDYLPFHKGLSQDMLNETAYSFSEKFIDITESLPKIWGTVSAIAKVVNKNEKAKKQNRDSNLNEKEQDIVCKLQYLAERKNLICFCDNINYWDRKSLILLYNILSGIDQKYSFFKTTTFILCYTNDKETDNLELIDKIKEINKMNCIKFPELQPDDYKISLQLLKYDKKLSDKEFKILISIINGHIRMLIDLISELNRNDLNLSDVEGQSKELFTEVLKNRLEHCEGMGELIKTTLEYASLLGLSFSIDELSYIISSNRNTFEKIIEHSNKMNLTEEVCENNHILKFAHDIIHSAFQQEATKNGSKYYERIELCLQKIAPSQYLRRYQYAFQAGNEEKALRLLVLEIVRQIRENKNIPNDINDILEKYKVAFNNKPEYYAFIQKIREAYEFYYAGDFNKSMDQLSLISDDYPVLFRIEKEILASCCYSKKIDRKYRNKGIQLLKNYDTLEKCENELEIYERVHIRLLILYVHIGETDKGIEEEKIIMDSLDMRREHDLYAQSCYYILNRISNALHDCEIAVGKMKIAVEYFGKDYGRGGLWRDIKQYFLSGINYAGALCLNGEFYKGFEQCNNMWEIWNKFSDYPFPRINILVNNWLVTGYLSGELNAEYCEKRFLQLITPIPRCAERLFYKSNHSIFMALLGNIKKAKEYLQKEYELQMVMTDAEGLYNYRVVVNSAVYNYLLGHREEALNLLNGLIEYMEKNKLTFSDNIYDYRRANEIKKHIETHEGNELPEKWENALLDKTSNCQKTAWNYYGKAYVFTTTFNWDL